MYTNQTDNGILNNYPTETQVYCATYPDLEEQRGYIIQGAIAALLVTGVIMTAFIVS